MVEVDATFYHVLSPVLAEKWMRDVRERPDFQISLKLWRGFTHERPAKLPEGELNAVKEMCARLQSSDRLACLLAQFPWSFRYSTQSLEYLARLLDHFQDHPVAVEVRHAAWANPRFYEFLRERGVAFCNIDQPALQNCLGLSAVSTASFSYLRLHGRNAPNWFGQNEKPSDRYDYLYDSAEIVEIGEQARALADQTDKVMVVANNHYRGQAAVNALELAIRLGQSTQYVPAPLLKAYPRLEKLGLNPLDAGRPQMDLFEP
jgi:uncharacterized protein YecE (DUF72 family)